MTRRRIVGGIITLTLALGGSVLAATRGGAAAGQGRLVGIQGCVLTFEFRGFSSTDRGRLGLFEEESGDPLGNHAFNFTPIGTKSFDAEPLLTSKQKNDGVEIGFRVWVNNHLLGGAYVDDPPLSCPDASPPPPPPPPPPPAPPQSPPPAPPAATPVTGEPAFTG